MKIINFKVTFPGSECVDWFDDLKEFLETGSGKNQLYETGVKRKGTLRYTYDGPFKLKALLDKDRGPSSVI